MLSSKSILTVLFMLLLFSLPLSAIAIDILVLPTVSDPGMDAWQHVPANSEPTIYPTKRVYRGQPFRLLVLAKDYASDAQQNTDLKYFVQVFAPNGAALLDQGTILELYKGTVSSSTFLLLSRQYLTLDFSEADPFGTYRIQITAHDLLAEQETVATASLLLAPVSERPARRRGGWSPARACDREGRAYVGWRCGL